MILLLISKSRTVHNICHDDHQAVQDNQDNNIDNSNEAFISLTLWRKSLLLSCNGFTVISSNGSLLYRVDNYSGRPDPIVLMDGSGNPIFTICRRQRGMRLMDKHWLVYEGEVVGTKNCKNNTNNSPRKMPVFCVRKSKISIRKSKTMNSELAHVYSGNIMSDNRHKYAVEGSYMNRSCKILDESRKIVGEIKRKEAIGEGVSYGLEVFNLTVKPGFESSFAMAIVLVLDQMFS